MTREDENNSAEIEYAFSVSYTKEVIIIVGFIHWMFPTEKKKTVGYTEQAVGILVSFDYTGGSLHFLYWSK